MSKCDLEEEEDDKGADDGLIWKRQQPIAADNEHVKGYDDDTLDNTEKPLLYCRIITRYPKTAFGITLTCHLLMLVTVIFLVYIGYDVFPVNFKTFPLNIRDNKYYLRGLSWQFRNQKEEIIKRGQLDSTANHERTETKEVITWIFHKEEKNLLLKSNLLLMKNVEDELFHLPSFQDHLCRLENNETCFKPVSILRFFDGTYKDIDPVFYDPEFNNVQQVLYKASYYNQTKLQLGYHLDVNAYITSSNVTSNAIRSHMTIGYPLKGYDTVNDRTKEQQDKIENYLREDFVPAADKYFQNGVGPMKFFYESRTILLIYVNDNVATDMMLANGSFCFIFLFMWLQTGSLWVTGWAVLSILTGFCSANLIYRIPLDFRYFGVFHVLSLFIILGIGADDVFVFFDIWKQSSLHKYKSLAHRLSDCYHRAALAMLYTSLTTAVAFIVSATSPFLAVYTFGIFSGILVCVNYLSVIIYFPCVIVTYHLYFEKYKCCCCCVKSPSMDKSTGKILPQRKNPIVIFFRGPYYRFVTHKVIRWIIVAIFTLSLGVFIYFATQLQVNEEQIKFLPDNTNFAQYLALRGNAFSTVDAPIKIYIIFGLKEQDLSSCHRTDSLCFGDTVWDRNMDINDGDSQLALLDLCNKIKSLPESRVQELQIRRNIVSGNLEVQCFLEDMQEFLDASVSNPHVKIPLNKNDTVSIMEKVPQIYNTNLLPSNFGNWFEIVSSYWLYNGFVQSTGLSQDFKTYSSLLGEAETNTTVSTQIGEVFTYKYGTKMKYVALVVNTTINPRTIGYVKGQVIREKWETFINTEVSRMPSSLHGGYQTTSKDTWAFNLWHWLEIQQILANSAIKGLITGLSLALPILVIATMNIYVGLLATLTLCCITVSVVGVIPMAGWKLGVLESLNLVLVVGLAVDYCVHLAVAYSRAPFSDRGERVRYALEEMGISVISGCCSTLGASIFLMFAHILFFTQFGSVMFCTIGFSILYALVFFVTVLGIAGPEKEVGSLKKLFKKSKCCKSKPSEGTLDNKEMSSTV